MHHLQMLALACFCILAAAAAQADSNQEFKPGASRTNSIDGLEYAWIPAGEFQMGCLPDDNDCDKDEFPRHKVKLTQGFWITKTEVTVEAYKKFAAATERPLPEPPPFNENWEKADHPIVRVKWADAQAFCEWAGGTLPTEAQWKYAARGGRGGRIYPWGNTISHEDANYRGTEWQDAWLYTSPVGSFRPNPWGLYDMAGNAWEWLADWYAGNYFDFSPLEDPAGAPSGFERVLVGGSWFNVPRVLRVSDRFKLVPKSFSHDIGFRCVCAELP